MCRRALEPPRSHTLPAEEGEGGTGEGRPPWGSGPSALEAGWRVCALPGARAPREGSPEASPRPAVGRGTSRRCVRSPARVSALTGAQRAEEAEVRVTGRRWSCQVDKRDRCARGRAPPHPPPLPAAARAAGSHHPAPLLPAIGRLGADPRYKLFALRVPLPARATHHAPSRSSLVLVLPAAGKTSIPSLVQKGRPGLWGQGGSGPECGERMGFSRLGWQQGAGGWREGP